MANNVLLNNVTHKNLKIITSKSSKFGDNLGYTLLIPREFREASFIYPIVFRKVATENKYEAVALLGFNENENVFLQQNEWMADYIPLSIERRPFMIGYAYDQSTGEQHAMIHVDMDSPKVSFSEGVDVFLQHGGNSPYLEWINSMLVELLNGVNASKQFIDMLLAEELLEDFSLKISLDDNSTIAVNGFATINEEKLRALNGNQLARLHDKNFLELIYIAIASLANIKTMIKMKQKHSHV